MKEIRKIEFYEDYFIKFYLKLSPDVQKKYEYIFVVVRQTERIPIKFFKKITNKSNLYEIRLEVQFNIYRTFCCLDGNSVVILFNSFQKKPHKTPVNQIIKAEKLKKAYYDEKK